MEALLSVIFFVDSLEKLNNDEVAKNIIDRHYKLYGDADEKGKVYIVDKSKFLTSLEEDRLVKPRAIAFVKDKENKEIENILAWRVRLNEAGKRINRLEVYARDEKFKMYQDFFDDIEKSNASMEYKSWKRGKS